MTERIYLERTYGSPEAAIIQPEKQVPVTVYNVDHWLPRLGVQRWALVQLLRRLAMDASQATDGTRRLETTREELAKRLGVDWPGTIGQWLQSEPIPGRKGWRKISPVDEASKALAHFIPRLRYTYKRGDGKTRRTGLALYIRMDEPLIPEDQARLEEVAATLIQERMEQAPLIQSTESIKEEKPTSRNIKSENPISQEESVNGEKPASQSTVKQEKSISQLSVIEEKPISRAVKLENPIGTLNERTNYLTRIEELAGSLDLNLTDGRRIRGQLTPLVKATEDVLSDYHSTQMLYKVLKALYRAQRFDLFLQAVGTAVRIGEMDASANLGAIFVSEIKRLGREEQVNVGLVIHPEAEMARGLHGEAAGEKVQRRFTPQIPQLLIPGYGDSRKLWDSALEDLKLRMTKATFATWMRDTWIADYRPGTRGSGEEDCLVIRVQNEYTAEWLANRLSRVITRTLSGLVGHSVEVEFKVGSCSEHRDTQAG